MKKIFLVLLVVIAITITGCGKEKEYTIRFDSNGGNLLATQTIKENGFVTRPVNPKKIDYVFSYWSLDNKEYDFKTPVTKDLTLKAIWLLDTKRTITFDTNGGLVMESIEIDKNTKLTKPDNPIKEGYRFKTWLLNDQEYDFETVVTENITLVASWEKIEIFKVIFDNEGVTTTIEYEKDEVLGKITNPIKVTDPDDYVFGGWYKGKTKYSEVTKITKDITLTAKWIREYTVTFMNDTTKIKEVSVLENATIATIPSFLTKAGYTFSGWYNGTIKCLTTTVVTSDTICLAVFIPLPKEYTVTWSLVDDNNPTGNLYLTVKENGIAIPAKEIQTLSGVLITDTITNNKFVVSSQDVSSVTSVKVKLNTDDIVTALLSEENK